MFKKFLDSKTWEGKKERRKQYRGAKAIDPSCRNNKFCYFCIGNRTFFDRKNRELADLQLEMTQEDINLLLSKEKIKKAIEHEKWEEVENYSEKWVWHEK